MRPESVAQQYVPDELVGRRWYEPSRHGDEAEIAERMNRRRWRPAMTAGELAVLTAAVLCSIGFAALVVVLMRVLDALRELGARSRTCAPRRGHCSTTSA